MEATTKHLIPILSPRHIHRCIRLRKQCIRECITKINKSSPVDCLIQCRVLVQLIPIQLSLLDTNKMQDALTPEFTPERSRLLLLALAFKILEIVEL